MPKLQLVLEFFLSALKHVLADLCDVLFWVKPCKHRCSVKQEDLKRLSKNGYWQKIDVGIKTVNMATVNIAKQWQ